MLFCCFEAFLGKFTENFSFRAKTAFLRKDHRNTQKVCFSWQVWKGENPEVNLDLFKQMFLNNSVDGGKYKQKLFFSQSEPHTIILCFSVILKHFGGNSQRTSLFTKKWLSQ